MIPSRIRPDTKIYRFPETGKPTKAKAADSAQCNNSILSRAFATQRLELFEQPSSSKDLRLIALDKLEQRGFKPALGGLEIPSTGKAMGGMPKRTSRVNVPIIREELIRMPQYQQESEDIRRQIATQLDIIRRLALQSTETNLTEERRQELSEGLNTAREKLTDLEISLNQLPDRIRQTERGRGQGSVAGSSSQAGSQRGWHPGSYSGSRRG